MTGKLISPTKTSADAHRKVRAKMHPIALAYLNTPGREDDSGHDQVKELVGMLERAWDDGFETAMAAEPRTSEPLCGEYLGDNDGTCPQLTCIRRRGHVGAHDNIVSDDEPCPHPEPCPLHPRVLAPRTNEAACTCAEALAAGADLQLGCPVHDDHARENRRRERLADARDRRVDKVQGVDVVDVLERARRAIHDEHHSTAVDLVDEALAFLQAQRTDPEGDDPNQAAKAIIWLARHDPTAGLTMKAAIAEYDRRIALCDRAKAGVEGA